MPFSARNARYLRISAHTVLPLYVYLDDKHVEWMTDYTLQRVLEDLRPVIGPKLQVESNLQSVGGSSAKKGTVDVYRGDTYQFAYFFRKNEPHAVLIKSRKFTPSASLAKSSETLAVGPPQLSGPQSRKRSRAKSKTSSTKSAPEMRIKLKKTARLSDSNQDGALENTGSRDPIEFAREGSARRSLRKTTLMPGGYRESDWDRDDVVMVDSDHDTAEVDTAEGIAEDDSSPVAQNIQHGTIAPQPDLRLSPEFNVDTEDEEVKPKLSMRVTYQGFTIYDRCLCVVIEPWPTTLRDRSQTRSVAPSQARDPDSSKESGDRTPITSIRERTPLFLPELDPRRSYTPVPPPSRFLPPVPLFDANVELEDHGNAIDEGGIMAFSQVLKSVGGERAGSADDDENEDVFLGDADERRADP